MKNAPVSLNAPLSEQSKKGSDKNDNQNVKGGFSDVSGENPMLAAIGLESEFTLFLNDVEATPEKVFGDPTKLLRALSLHRVGSSYHIANGGAVYFDSGALEVVTPIIEIEKECAARAGRSLWEGIQYLRSELDNWDLETGNKTRLEGFSTHYNISFEKTKSELNENQSVEKLALLLSYILPIPVMLLVANKKSTGIGVRPRGNRIEITADFTPSASLMVAATTLITGIVRKVMTWPSYELDMLEKMNIPVIKSYKPMKHTSRQGWLARYDCYDTNPFTCNIGEQIWDTTEFDSKQSLRDIASVIQKVFYYPVARISGSFAFRLITSVFSGKMASLLDLDDRPKEYEDVGKLCTWDNLFPEKELSRSKYERVLISSILKRTLTVDGKAYVPVGMKGWTKVVFVEKSSKARKAFNVDFLIGHLEKWEKADTLSKI